MAVLEGWIWISCCNAYILSRLGHFRVAVIVGEVVERIMVKVRLKLVLDDLMP